MYGLFMDERYAAEILSGEKKFDARAYPTQKRGTVAIIGSVGRQILGTVKLTGCHEITGKEYVDWHCTGVFKNKLVFNGDINKTYYAYDMEEPILFRCPLVYWGAKRTFVELTKEDEQQVLLARDIVVRLQNAEREEKEKNK